MQKRKEYINSNLPEINLDDIIHLGWEEMLRLFQITMKQMKLGLRVYFLGVKSFYKIAKTGL